MRIGTSGSGEGVASGGRAPRHLFHCALLPHTPSSPPKCPPLPELPRRAIARDFPADFLTQDPAELLEYGRDRTRVFTPDASAIAFPRTTAEVSALLKLCSAHSLPVVPSGGLARGTRAARFAALNGELVAPRQRQAAAARYGPRRPPGGDGAQVQAGAGRRGRHRHAAEQGLTWPIDLAAKGQCQIGGNVSTNAGGVRVIRYGHTRHWVLGLQVVLASGEILELGGALEKNNTGLDLRQLFIGSEGTLGIVTEATLKLCAPPPARRSCSSRSPTSPPC